MRASMVVSYRHNGILMSPVPVVAERIKSIFEKVVTKLLRPIRKDLER